MRPVLSALLLLSGAVAAEAQETVRVIASASVPGVSIGRKALADIYLKRAARWSNGLEIQPVDQSASSQVRAQFSQLAFGQPTVWVTNEWSRMIAAGMGFPPLVKTSDQDVMAHVAKAKGGIGYVGADAPLEDNVKVLRVIE